VAGDYPIEADRVAAMLAGLFEAQGDRELAQVLRSAAASIEQTGYDNWNEGTYFYTLYLELPVPIYARVEPDLPRVEETLSAKLRTALRGQGDHVLSSSVITPALDDVSDAEGQGSSADDLARLWAVDMLRLFVSHVSAHKVAVSNLKSHLARFGVSAFVAHEDVEPSLEWQREILTALHSMDAMAVILTADFHESYWTDQEIGVAIERGVLVVPIRAPINPYGFIAKTQGMRADLAEPAQLASGIVEILLRRARTRDIMRDALVAAIEFAQSFATAKAVTDKLEAAGQFSPAQRNRVAAAVRSNSQVSGSFGVPERLGRLAPPVTKAADSDEQDDLPF
jgi:hypothetical protein